jgi:hypothetical protein
MCQSFLSFGQDLSEYEKVYYAVPDPIETDDFTLSVKNGVALAEYSKLSMKITNNSNDYLIYYSKESKITMGSDEYTPKSKACLITPNNSRSRTIQVDGGESFRQKNYSFEVKGLYRIPVDGDVQKSADFKLPASSNGFTDGNFKVVLRKYDASTKEAKAQFECTYQGDGVALVNSANLSVKAKKKGSDEEVVYANDNKKSTSKILHKGDKVKFTALFHIPGKIVDMQFATMHIMWNDTFIETKEVPLEAETFEIEMDEALTKEKN